MWSIDLTGRIFQRLIADRKYLATFYTLPASAALLARLAIDKLTNTPVRPAHNPVRPEPVEGHAHTPVRPEPVEGHAYTPFV